MDETAQVRHQSSKEPTSDITVGVVGIGDMGAGIATAVLRHHPVVVSDLRKRQREEKKTEKTIDF